MIKEKYKEDVSDIMINSNILSKELNLNNNIVDESLMSIEDQEEKIKEMRQTLLEVDEDTSDDILRANIQRANSLLDKAEKEFNSGINARLLEVCGQLINAITSAASTISTNSFGNMKNEYQMKLLQIEEDKLNLKKIMMSGRDTPVLTGANTSVIVTDRESLMRMMKDSSEIEIN